MKSTVKTLIRRLASPDNAQALEALEELRKRGLLTRDKRTLERANLSGADLSSADFSGVFMWKANFDKATLVSAKIEGAMLLQSLFRGANLRGAILDGAQLAYVSFESADLSNASLRRTECNGSKFTNTILHGTDFQGAVLAGVDFARCDLSQVQLEGASLATANLEGAIVRLDQLLEISILVGATMPDGARYDGRFRLVGDLDLDASIGVDTTDDVQMAKRYYVSLATYRAGQAWADENLPRPNDQ